MSSGPMYQANVVCLDVVNVQCPMSNGNVQCHQAQCIETHTFAFIVVCVARKLIKIETKGIQEILMILSKY